MWTWSWNPWPSLTLAASAVMYASGAWRLTRRPAGIRALQRHQVVAFAGGWLVAALALISPIDTVSELLLSVHMSQHMLLILIAAPLLVLGRPGFTMLWALPASWRIRVGHVSHGAFIRPVWRAVTHPLVAFVAHAIAIWTWHVPLLYDAAVAHDGIHFVEHITFVFTAGLFWWALIEGRYGRAGYGVSVFYVFATAAHSGLLGALMAVAPRTWYPPYDRTAVALGFEPLKDQQFAGVLMWVLAGVLLALFALALFAAWIGESERRADARDTALTASSLSAFVSVDRLDRRNRTPPFASPGHGDPRQEKDRVRPSP